MNNNILLSLAISIIPMLGISFVVLLVIYKIYIKIRSRFNANVNCWFCNRNSKVPYLEANSWTCPSCEQYNGFDKNGDYNREIYEQLDCSRTSQRFNVSDPLASSVRQSSKNGFCDECNEAQRLKVEKLALFEPKHESNWDKEFKMYKAKLEDQYRICSTCNRHLKQILREKKKMVLGSKFLDFIIKGAETLKQPHFNQIQHANQEERKQKLRSLIIIVSLINLYCLINSLPSLSKDHFVKFLGENVILSYLEAIKKYAVVTKLSLFSRTVFMMAMYSMGLKVTHSSFSSFYVNFSPFAVLALTFFHNIVDGFRLTRFTGLMAIWSIFAGGIIEEYWTILTPQILMFFTSFLTLVMAYSSKSEPSPKLYDTTSNSFHKIYSEDYLSDDETMSILSQQLNGSGVSFRSTFSNKSSPSMHTKISPRLTRCPLTSSTLSVHQLPRCELSPNSSFRSYIGEQNQTIRAGFASPMTMPDTTHQNIFASNLELNTCRERPVSRALGMNASDTNSLFLNNSFTESNISRHSHNNYDSFYTAANNSSNNSMFVKTNHNFVAPKSLSGIHSPFSASSSSVYHQPNPRNNTHHNLLSPTRFSTNNLASSNTSWLSGGYFNQRQSISDIPRNGLVIPTIQTQSHTTPMEECLSRSSSHSSGFESQNGRLNGNVSRENSMCPDLNLDYHRRAFTVDNINRFQPIDSPSLGSYSPRTLENNALWKQPTFTYRSSNNINVTKNSIDSFNLHKINEELPPIKRSDLLQQWKERQAIS